MSEHSMPKDRMRFLLLEGVSPSAVQSLAADGYHNVERLSKALESTALRDALQGVHILGIRSRTRIDLESLTNADSLMAVGCFCIGTDQVNLSAARERGIPVFNAPFSNTRSVAELVLGEIVMLLRGIPARSTAAHAGRWEKSSEGSREVRGKTLGIVGYGNIGSQLSVLAEALGMRVAYFDTSSRLPHGNATRMDTLHDLLAASDVVSLHVPEDAGTVGMIGMEEVNRMRHGAVLINNARGRLVDLDAVASALRSGHLQGGAFDVFPQEPGRNGDVFSCPLQGIPNVIITPHIGGSTEEAQDRIGSEVARRLADYIDVGSTTGSVNFPQVQLPIRSSGTRYMHVHRNIPGILQRINSVLSARGLNISAQYLQTDGDLGYVVVEADGQTQDAQEVLAELHALEGTVRARLLHE